MEDAAPQLKSTRGEYEERVLAADAVPLYSVPDDVIEGEHGLVRSVILNDRIHSVILTVVKGARPQHLSETTRPTISRPMLGN